jgi:SAM-dependent methyltransferase
MDSSGGTQRSDVWASGAAYEPYVGRWSRLVAREFVSWLAVPPNSRWLDIGAGTGALAQTILQVAEPQEVKGIDPSEGFIEYARKQVTDARVSFEIGDAQALPPDIGSFDAVASGLALNFAAQPERMVAEMKRVTKPGGVVGAYVWDYANDMQLMRYFWNAVVELDPAAQQLDEGVRFPICKPEPLAQLFTSTGLQNMQTRSIDVPTVFRNFDDYWSPFLSGQAPAPLYTMSMTEAGRTALREKIRSTLPISADGSIHLIARAWAVRGAVA